MKDYDTIFVGYPIRWYVAPTIIPFATTGGSGIGKTNARTSDISDLQEFERAR